MARPKSQPKSIRGFGCIYQPTYRDKKTGEKKRSSVWWMKYDSGEGKPVYLNTGLEDQAAAYNELAKLHGRKAIGDNVTVGPERVTFSTLFDLLVADYRRKRRSSLTTMQSQLNTHLRPHFDNVRVQALRRKDLDRFIEKCLSGYEAKNDKGEKVKYKLAPATVNKLISFMRRAMSLGVAEEPQLVLRIPPWFEKLEEHNTRTGIMDENTYRALRNRLPSHARIALVISYHLGIRTSEVLGLRWDQFDMQRGILDLAAKTTKNRKARLAPIYGDMRAFLEMTKAEQDAKYPGCKYVCAEHGRRIYSIKTAWKHACEAVGVDSMRFHDLRRTASTNMDRAGISGIMIDQIVGWKTEAMRRRYRIGEERDAQDVGRKMDAYRNHPTELAEVVAPSVRPS